LPSQSTKQLAGRLRHRLTTRLLVTNPLIASTGDQAQSFAEQNWQIGNYAIMASGTATVRWSGDSYTFSVNMNVVDRFGYSPDDWQYKVGLGSLAPTRNVARGTWIVGGSGKKGP